MAGLGPGITVPLMSTLTQPKSQCDYAGESEERDMSPKEARTKPSSSESKVHR